MRIPEHVLSVSFYNFQVGPCSLQFFPSSKDGIGDGNKELAQSKQK